MSMDDLPNNIDKTSPSLTEEPIPRVDPDPTPKCSRRYGGLCALTICAVVLGVLGTMTYQYLYPTTQSVAPAFSSHGSEAQPWEEMQAQIQELRESQKAMQQQTASHRQQIQHLLQESPAVLNQDLSIQQARYYLELAQINARWSNNIASTISLLRSADSILAQTNLLNTHTLRQAIAEDLTALEKIPTINTNEVVSKINTISQQIAQLSTYPVAVDTTQPQHQPPESPSWRDNLYDNMQQLRGLITIQHHDEAWLPPSPNTIALLRENIRMTLQQARLGLIEQHQSLFTSALQAASDSISASFDPSDPKTAAVIKDLQALQTTKVAYPMPTLHHYAQLIEQNSDLSPATKGSS